MAQEEIISFLQSKAKEDISFTAKEISQKVFGTPNDRKVRRALRGLVAFDQVHISFKRVRYGFIPTYKIMETKTKNKR